MTSKNILYINTTPDISEPIEVIEKISAFYGYGVERHKYFDPEGLKAFLKSTMRPFDLLYFASHGDPNGVQANNEYYANMQDLSWTDLGNLFCTSQGLNENSAILLASCDAGFKRTSLELMSVCPNINMVAGLPCKMETKNEPMIFHSFLHGYSNEWSGNQIEQSVESASGQQMRVHHRYNMDVEIAFYAEIYLGLGSQQEELEKAA